MLNRSLAHHILKYYATSMPLKGLLDDEEAEVLSNSNNYRPNNSFNWENILRKYKSRRSVLEDLHVCMCCTKHQKQHCNINEDSTTHLSGYCNKPEYLLDNTFEK